MIRPQDEDREIIQFDLPVEVDDRWSAVLENCGPCSYVGKTAEVEADSFGLRGMLGRSCDKYVRSVQGDLLSILFLERSVAQYEVRLYSFQRSGRIVHGEEFFGELAQYMLITALPPLLEFCRRRVWPS